MAQYEKLTNRELATELRTNLNQQGKITREVLARILLWIDKQEKQWEIDHPIEACEFEETTGIETISYHEGVDHTTVFPCEHCGQYTGGHDIDCPDYVNPF